MWALTLITIMLCGIAANCVEDDHQRDHGIAFSVPEDWQSTSNMAGKRIAFNGPADGAPYVEITTMTCRKRSSGPVFSTTRTAGCSKNQHWHHGHPPGPDCRRDRSQAR
jgi:hypothetical protein